MPFKSPIEFSHPRDNFALLISSSSTTATVTIKYELLSAGPFLSSFESFIFKFEFLPGKLYEMFESVVVVGMGTVLFVRITTGAVVLTVVLAFDIDDINRDVGKMDILNGVSLAVLSTMNC